MEQIATATQREIDHDQLQLYYQLLSDIPDAIFKQSVLRWLQESENTFMPSIGQLRRYAAELTYGVLPDWSVEWQKVLKCIGPLALRHKKQEAKKRLGEFTWKVVSQVGWESLCDSELLGIEKAAFRQIYTAEAERESNRRKLSIELRPRVGFVMEPQEQNRMVTNG